MNPGRYADRIANGEKLRHAFLTRNGDLTQQEMDMLRKSNRPCVESPFERWATVETTENADRVYANLVIRKHRKSTSLSNSDVVRASRDVPCSAEQKTPSEKANKEKNDERNGNAGDKV